jgi:trimeric autotransporter adhesin
MRLPHVVFLASTLAVSVFGQSYTISTFAGGGLPVNIPGTSADIQPWGVAVDAAGDVFITDLVTNTVLRLDATTGGLTLVAGNGIIGFSGDSGPASNAQLGAPSSVAVDSAGNVYIADRNNNRIRKVSNGAITTVAGNGTQGFSGDAARLPAAN